MYEKARPVEAGCRARVLPSSDSCDELIWREVDVIRLTTEDYLYESEINNKEVYWDIMFNGQEYIAEDRNLLRIDPDLQKQIESEKEVCNV